MIKKIVVTGYKGFLGRNVYELLKKEYEVIGCTKSDGIDIRNYELIYSFLKKHQPDIVVHCAAHVGGIAYNAEKPIEIFEDNLKIGMNIVKASAQAKVSKFLNVMPNCTYPGALDIYKEEQWWDGEIHKSVLTYGLPRKTIWGLTWAYKQKKLLDSVHLVLPNMYGPFDHFDILRSHALGALIKKITDAKRNNKEYVEIWGTGKPVREWLYVKDGAKAIYYAIKNFDKIGINILNIGVGKGISITELAEIIKEEVEYKGKFKYLTGRPDGAMIKILDASRMEKIFNWKPQISIRQGIKETVDWYNGDGCNM